MFSFELFGFEYFITDDPALLVGALLPVAVILWYVFKKDAYPEPPHVVWTTFGLGVLTLVPLMYFFGLVGWALSDFENPFLYAFGAAFLEAAVPEEFLKWCVLFFYAYRHDAFDEPMDGIVYGVAASLGFAAIENILYVSDGDYELVLIRALTAVPSHAMDGVIMGFYLGIAKALPNQRGEYIFKSLAVPVVLHGLYDYPLMLLDPWEMDYRDSLHLVDYPWGLVTFAVIVLQVFVVYRLWKRLRDLQDKRLARETAREASGGA